MSFRFWKMGRNCRFVFAWIRLQYIPGLSSESLIERLQIGRSSDLLGLSSLPVPRSCLQNSGKNRAKA